MRQYYNYTIYSGGYIVHASNYTFDTRHGARRAALAYIERNEPEGEAWTFEVKSDLED